jgi:amidase
VYELRAAYDAALEEVDVLVTPVTPTVAMPHPNSRCSDSQRSTIIEKISLETGLSSNTSPFNATGHPAMSVLSGIGAPKDRTVGTLPISMSLLREDGVKKIFWKRLQYLRRGKN